MKHLVDVDDELLADARRALGTSTIKDTVDASLRLTVERRRSELSAAIDDLAQVVSEIPVKDRSDAW